MAHRVLELTLVSASDLKDVNFFSDMEVYAVASLNGDPHTSQQTQTDRDGGRYPEWHETLRFNVPATATAASAAGSYLHVLLRTERAFGFDDRDVGELLVPVADLLAGASASGTQRRCASYQVRKVQCVEHHGVLSVSYRLGPVMAPVRRDTERCRDGVGYPVMRCQPRYPPSYAYAPPYYQSVGLQYPLPYVRTLAPKNVMKKNGGFALGLGAGRWNFGGLLFGTMVSTDTSAYDNAGYETTDDAGRVVF